MLRNLVTTLGVLSVVLFCTAVATAAYIPVTDLGIPAGYTAAAAYDFNANGDVAVQADTGPAAFNWNSGTYTNIGTLGGTYAYPRGIDEDGTIVGMSRTSTSTSSGMAYKWTSGGGMVALGTLGGTQSRGDFINSGDIIGSSQITGNSAWHAFVIYSGSSTMTDIGTLGGSSYAYKINDSQHVVGLTQPSGNRGFYYDGTTMTSIGTLTDDTASIAYGMNNADVVVGYSQKTGVQTAIMWTPTGGMSPLSFLDATQTSASATEINNLDQIVGWSNIMVGSTVERHAVIWDGGTVIDLNDLIDPALGWRLEYPTMIDDNGTIAGYGYINGEKHPFMLTYAPVPEPSTLALLAAGLVGLLAYAWRKRK